ncbi:MAG: endonuclease/exonuclease/phosphatase family protein [Deltaproteobacteria bacterium]
MVRTVRRLLVGALAFLLILVLAILWMAGGVQSPATTNQRVVVLDDAATSTATDTLDVVVWNIAWGYGWGSEGTGHRKPRRHFERSIRQMGEVLRDAGADLVLLQEVDFDTSRSYGVDQARRIAEIAGLKYVAYAESWTANWVPFPYWPVEDHFGRMHSGGAILSRFPIERNEVELLPKPAENAFHYNLFYLFRYLQAADVAVGDRSVRVYNTHLEAFSRLNREQQAATIATKVAMYEGSTIFGGDLNSVPPESDVRGHYPDEPHTDHDGDPTVATMRAIDGLADTIPATKFSADPAAYFTFPAHEPNRMLDHLFVSKDWTVEASGVLKAAGDVSDHLPIYAKLRRR